MIVLANSKQKKRVTDLIKPEDVLNWKPNDYILIASPMGAGKSYFSKNTLNRGFLSESITFFILCP